MRPASAVTRPAPYQVRHAPRITRRHPEWTPPAGRSGYVFTFRDKLSLVSPEAALPGRNRPILTPDSAFHEVLGTKIDRVPEGAEVAYFAMGCFWGAEKLFWQVPGVISTAVGYQGGHTPNPTYEEVCSANTAHAEVVQVVFDPSKVSYADLLRVFWEGHDPTQGMRQGNDRGTQYRSALYPTSARQADQAESSRQAFQVRLAAAAHGRITTEITEAEPFYYAERYHQQYLAKNPNGYCPVHATGVKCDPPSAS